MNEEHITQILSMLSNTPFFGMLVTILIICGALFIVLYIYNLIKNKMSMDSHNFNTSKDIIERISEENERLNNLNSTLQNENKALNLSISVQHLNSTKMLEEISNLERRLKDREFEIVSLNRKLSHYEDVENNLQ